MDFNALARVAKLAALFCFFLPWATVSCSGNEIATATGFQLMTGAIEPNPALADMGGRDAAQIDADPNAFAIAAFAFIAGGLAISAFLRAKVASGVLLAGALAGIALAYVSVQSLREGMTREIARSQERAADPDAGAFLPSALQRDVSRQIAGAVRVEEQEGLWAVILALAAAAALAGTGLATRRAPPPA